MIFGFVFDSRRDDAVLPPRAVHKGKVTGKKTRNRDCGPAVAQCAPVGVMTVSNYRCRITRGRSRTTRRNERAARCCVKKGCVIGAGARARELSNCYSARDNGNARAGVVYNSCIYFIMIYENNDIIITRVTESRSRHQKRSASTCLQYTGTFYPAGGHGSGVGDHVPESVRASAAEASFGGWQTGNSCVCSSLIYRAPSQ